MDNDLEIIDFNSDDEEKRNKNSDKKNEKEPEKNLFDDLLIYHELRNPEIENNDKVKIEESAIKSNVQDF